MQIWAIGTVVLRTSWKICLTCKRNKIKTCFSRRYIAWGKKNNEAVNAFLGQALKGCLNAGFRCLLGSQMFSSSWWPFYLTVIKRLLLADGWESAVLTNLMMKYSSVCQLEMGEKRWFSSSFYNLLWLLVE